MEFTKVFVTGDRKQKRPKVVRGAMVSLEFAESTLCTLCETV